MKSTLKNMVLVLFSVTLVSSAVVGAVNMITEDAIAQAKAEAVNAALRMVLPEYETTEKSDLVIDELPISVYSAVKGGETVGYAVESQTKQGFGGTIRMMVGFDTEGRIINVNVLEQNETPGLGANAEKESFRDQFKQAVPENGFTVTKSTAGEGEISAMTGATITTTAVTNAVNDAIAQYQEVKEGA